MWVYCGVRLDLNLCYKESQSSALPNWATNTVLMSRLELLTTALWEQLSAIEIHQNIVGIQGIEPWLLPYQGSFLTIRRYANIADTEWLEHSSFRFGVWGFIIKLSAN